MRQQTELIVHLNQLSENYKLVKELAPNNEVIFMVKANAYGHGLLAIVHHAFYELGIRQFGCASLGEALEVRKQFPSMECELWVFSDSNLNDENSKELYLDYKINPVIHNMRDLERVLTDKDFTHLPLVIMLDTGMHRLGLDPNDVEEIVRLLKVNGRKNIKHLMTHFANSFLPIKENDKNHRQYNLFKECLNKFRELGISIEETSCSNSGAIEQSFGLEESHIRPGLMMYGPSSMLKSKNWKGKSISSFKTEVIKIMPIKKGMPIGYGSHVCGFDGQVVYLPIGYGDGVITYYSGHEIQLYNQSARIMGRINMDITPIFFKHLPKELKLHTSFYFWDSEINDIADLSAQLKATPYQLFTGISSRVPRRYIK